VDAPRHFFSFVITGPRRPARKRGLPVRDPVIHTNIRQLLHFFMDCRVKPGNDEY
jgi:hypothetical protein